MVRRTDNQEPSSGSQKDKRAAGRKAGTDKSQDQHLCGWTSTPALASDDDNDIISWMRSARNGDNRQKNRRGSLCEEQFRHVFDLCTAIENKQVFERQILNCDRHPQNRHHEPRGACVAKATTSTTSAVDGTSQSPEQDKDGNRHSDDKRTSVARGGNRSAASMGKEGSLSREVPESSRVQGKNNSVKDEGDPNDGAKGSFNDSNDDGAEVKGLGTKCKADAACLDDARVSPAKVAGDGRKQEGGASSQKKDCELEEQQGQHENRQLVTRFRYSCAEESAFSEQSTHKRGSGSKYGDMDHQTADSGLSRTSTSVQPASRHQQQQQQQQHVAGDTSGGLEPRIMVLRKIMIQDSAPDVQSRDPDSSGFHPRVPRGHAHERHGPQNRGPVQAGSAMGHHSSSADTLSKKLDDGLTPEGADDTAVTSPTGRASAASEPLPSCSRSANEKERSQTLDLFCDGVSRVGYCYHNTIHQMTSLPMTEFLPAVERKIHRTRSTQREVTMDNINSVHLQNDRWYQHRQQQQQQQQAWRQQEPRTTADDEGSQGSERETSRVRGHHRSLAFDESRTGVGSDNRNFNTETIPSFPSFRPHYSISPLQRAREIAFRRLHGHLTQQPDGSETVTVPSPRYAPRVDQKYIPSRTRSACRLLGQVLSRRAPTHYYN